MTGFWILGYTFRPEMAMFLDCVSYGDRNILDTLLVCFENEVDM